MKVNPAFWHEQDPPPEWLGSARYWVTYVKDGRSQFLPLGYGVRSVMVRDTEALVRQLREKYPDAVGYFTL